MRAGTWRKILCGVAASVVATSTAATAWAHFFFVAPAEDQRSAVVVFGEDTIPDLDVPAEKVTLAGRDASGHESPLSLTPGDKVLHVKLPTGTTLIHGRVDYGIVQRGEHDPFLLYYHPKATLGAPTGQATLGDDAIVELVATPTDGGVKFRFLSKGQPLADASVTVIEPNYKEDKYATDAEGYTRVFADKGRYTVWAGHTLDEAGEFDGKPYKQIKHYATLVVDAP